MPLHSNHLDTNLWRNETSHEKPPQVSRVADWTIFIHHMRPT